MERQLPYGAWRSQAVSALGCEALCASAHRQAGASVAFHRRLHLLNVPNQCCKACLVIAANLLVIRVLPVKCKPQDRA